MYAKTAETKVKSENGEEYYFYDTKGIPRTRQEMDWAIINSYVIPPFRGSTTHEVEKLLDYVDIKLDWYIPSVEAFELMNFIRFSMGKEPENLNSKAHYFFIDCMLTSEEVRPYFNVRNLDYNNRKNDTLILSTREFSKSVLATFFILYIAWKGKRKNFKRPIRLGLYVSDNMKGNVAQTMDTIKNLVLKSEFLSKEFEYTKFNKDHVILIRHPRTDREIASFNRAMKEGKSLEEVKYRDERTFTLKGIGASGGRGPVSLDSLLHTDSGSVTMRDISVGDEVFTPNGTKAKVIKKSEVFNDRMFKLVYEDGRVLKVNETHINVIWSEQGKENIVTLDLIEKFKSSRIYTKVCEPIEYSHKEFPFDPYLLGVMSEAIPDNYYYGSISQRKGLLAGLLVSFGSVDKDTIFKHSSKDVVSGVSVLVRSLGGVSSCALEEDGAYTIKIILDFNPFLSGSQKKKWVKPSDDQWKKTELVGIEEIKSEPSQCITLDSKEHEFVVNDYIITHNSRDADMGRPDFAIFDDMVANEDDAYSKVKLETIESTIEGDISSSLHAGGSFRIFIGTAYHTMDPIYRRVADPSILPIVFPRAEVAPHGDIYNDKGELVKPALKKEEFISVWPDRMPFETQREAYRKAEASYEAGNVKQLASLNQEFYIRVISSTERLIQTDNIKFVNVDYIKSHPLLFAWFITTDFTTSNKKGSDLSAAMLWVRDAWGVDTMMSISIDHKTIEEQYDDVFKLEDEAKGYGAPYVEIGIEVDGPQQIHLYAIKKRAEELNRFIDIAKQINPQKEYKPMSSEGIRSKVGGDKLDRLRLRASDVDLGKVRINEDIPRYSVAEWAELETEFNLATREAIKSRYDDALDAFSQPVLIYLDLPSKELHEKTFETEKAKPKTFMDLVMDGDLEDCSENNSQTDSILDY